MLDIRDVFYTARFQGGFTLLELLIVLLILTLVLSVVPPLLSKAIPGTEMKAAARDIAAGLRFTRSQAITHREEANFHLNVEERYVKVAGKEKKHLLPKGIDITLDTLQSEQEDKESGAIRFFPDGGSTGGRVLLQNDNNTYAVNIDWFTGKTSITD